MPNAFAYLYAAFPSVLTSVQGGADFRLFRGLPNPQLTAVATLVAGMAVAVMALLAWWLSRDATFPGWVEVASVPWWAWAGDALQFLTVLAVFLTAGRAGAALFSALTVTGGAICSLVLDHFDLRGFDHHSVRWSRAAAAGLLSGGKMLMAC